MIRNLCKTMLILTVSLATGTIVAAQSQLEVWQQTLIIGGVDEPQTFDPHVNVTQIGGQRLFPNIYEGLIQYDENGQIAPLLAQSWSVSDDNLTYTFNLRDDVVFSDGTPFDAEAVRFAFDRLRTINKGPVNVFAEVAEVRVDGEHQVSFRLTNPFAPFLSALASWQGALMMSPSYVMENAGEDFGERHMSNHTAGTGPYMLQAWEPENQIVLVRNPHYWGEYSENGLERVVYRTIREPATGVQLLRRGGIDILERLVTDFAPSLETDPGVQVETRLSLGGSYGLHIHFNSMQEPFADVRVRQALSYAIDYERIIDQVYGQYGEQATGALPTEFNPWFNEAAGQYSYDPERARSLLAETGFGGQRFNLSLGWQAGNAGQRDIGQIVQQNLAQVGFNVQLEEMPLPVWREAIWTNNFDLIFVQFSLAYADPDARLWRAYHSSEFRQNGFNPGWLNEQYDQLLERARAESDFETRKRLYDEAQALLVDEAPTLFLANNLYTFAHRSAIDGLTWIPAYGPFFNAARISKDPAGMPR
jgi:peptide/nickel transport system substrate-binding protein